MATSTVSIDPSPSNGLTVPPALKAVSSLFLVSALWPASLFWLVVALSEERDPVAQAAFQSHKMQSLLILSLTMMGALGTGLVLAWKNHRDWPTASGLSLIIGSGWLLLVVSLIAWASL